MSNSMELAIALHHSPRLSRRVQEISVPADVLDVIRIASGDADALCRAENETGLDPVTLKEAAVLYVQQALFFDGADCYRTLGLDSKAPQEQLKEHHRWLIHWLHPDRCGDNEFGVFAERVNKAWNELRTPARREQYDFQLAATRPTREDIPLQPTDPGMIGPWRGDRFSSSTFTTLQRVSLAFVFVGFCSLIALALWFEAKDDKFASQQTPEVVATGNDAPAPETEPAKVANDVAATREESSTVPHEDHSESKDPVSPAVGSANAIEPLGQASVVDMGAEGDRHDSRQQTQIDHVDAAAVSAKEATAALDMVAPAQRATSAAMNVVTPMQSDAGVKKSNPRGGTMRDQAGSMTGAAAQIRASTSATLDADASKALSLRSNPPEPAATSMPDTAGQERISSPPSIDDAQVILKQLAGAYRAGDLAALMLLFVEEPQGVSRAAIYKQYKNLFTDSRERTLNVQIAGWITERNTLVALGQYQTALVSRSGGQPRTETGMVRIELRTEKGQVRILRLAHSKS